MPSTAKKPAFAPSVSKSNPKSKPASFKRVTWFGSAALLLLTLLVYIPSYKAGFIWDDDVIAANPLLREGWIGLRDIWFSVRFGDFIPLTATSFWLEWQVHGAMKEIQHTTNIILQAFNVVLLWRVLVHLRVPGAWLIAAIFAVHPVCVASVTWLAQRKNTLSMFFYLLSLLFYLRSESVEGRSAKKTYWLSFFFFICGLLSKSSVVVLPVVLLLCAWWRNGKIGRCDVRRVAPFFLFAFAAGVTTLVAHLYFGPKLGVLPTEENSFVRLLTAARAFWFYLMKGLLPLGLTMHYPRWKIDPVSPLAYLPGLAIVSLFLLFWRFRQSWGRACLFGLAYVVIALGPTIGVVNMAFLMLAQVADHFQYLALPGTIALIIGGGIYILQKTVANSQKTIPIVLFCFLIPPLAALSWKHQTILANPEALWRDNLKKNPESWAAHNNLGGIFFEKERYEEALAFYEKALERRGNLSMVHVNVGRALFALGKTDAAIFRYGEALRLDPTDFKAHNNLGVALITAGQTNEAIASFQKAFQLVPTDATFFANLARLLMETGRTQEAIQLFRERLRRLPTDSLTHTKMGQLLFSENKLDEATIHFREAVRLTPEFIEARFGLAEILARQLKTSEAITQWREILKRQPDALQVIANLAWALATDRNDQIRNGTEAVKLSEQACAIAGRNNPPYLDLLAAAYAEAGRFAEAKKNEEEAISLARASGQNELVQKYQSRLNLYQTGQPFRAP